jgi:hypothetical protein
VDATKANTSTKPEKVQQVHTSALLQDLIASATEDHFTLEWLSENLPKNSFGVIILFLGLISLLPVISVISRILLMGLALQIIWGNPSPVFPKRLMQRRLPSRYLSRLDRHAIPALRYLEKAVRPRWPGFLSAARRFTAFIAFLLIFLSLIVPFPFANIPPALINILMALAYIEHDGLLLAIALTLSLVLLGIVDLSFVSFFFHPF